MRGLQCSLFTIYYLSIAIDTPVVLLFNNYYFMIVLFCCSCKFGFPTLLCKFFFFFLVPHVLTNQSCSWSTLTRIQTTSSSAASGRTWLDPISGLTYPHLLSLLIDSNMGAAKKQRLLRSQSQLTTELVSRELKLVPEWPKHPRISLSSFSSTLYGLPWSGAKKYTFFFSLRVHMGDHWS